MTLAIVHANPGRGVDLDTLLAEAGVKRGACAEFYATQSSEPTDKELREAAPGLLEKLQELNPAIVLVLGSRACLATLRRKDVGPVRGKLVERGGVKWFPVVHPAIVQARPSQGVSLRADFRRLGKLLRGEATEPQAIDWKLATDEDVPECVAAIEAAGEAAFDLETTGLDPLTGEILLVGVAAGSKAWCFPVAWPGYERPNLVPVFEALSGVESIAHNGKFDGKWIRHHFGVPVRLAFDTMLAQHLLDENGPKGLKPLAKLHFDADDYELPQPMDPAEVELEKAAQYCCLDVHYTLRLKALQVPELAKDPRLEKLLKRLLMPASRALEVAELGGAYLDGERLPVVTAKAVAARNKAHEEFEKAVGRPVNCNSPKQVAEALAGANVPLGMRTDSGALSTSAEALSFVMDDPVVKKLFEFRDSEKDVQFLEAWRAARDVDGYIHPTFKIAGTVTGRLSSSDPNFQQVPKKAELRSLFCAPPGYVLIEADYSQGELRLAAEESGDSELCRVYAEGGDVHRTTAAEVLAKLAGDVSKDERDLGKPVNFGYIYGMGWRRMIDYARNEYGVTFTEEQSQAFRERFFNKYRDLPPWHERRQREAKRNKAVRSAFGRLRRLPDIDSPVAGVRAEAQRAAVNAGIQAWLSDLMLFSIVRLAQVDWLRGVGPVHDAGIWYAPQDRVDEAAALIQGVMQDVDTPGRIFGFQIRRVPMVADVKIGPWGKGTKWTK